MNITTNSETGEIVVTGKGVAPGIAIGPVYVYSRTQLHVEEESIEPELVEKELKRLRHALKQSGRDLKSP